MSTLRVPALEIVQSPGRPVYSFGVDGKMLHRIAAISRVGRNDDMSIRGYQRPEVLAHIQAIRSYLESPSPMIPNGIVVAFDERVRFESRASETAPSRAGKLVIPLDDEYRPGWIVDGQQRAAAIRDARIEAFPIMVNAFITEDVGEQRAQFILVNSTKPLPKGLIHELLPSTGAPLPLALHRRRLPALLLERLNFDPDSPLRGRIRTPTSGEGTIKDNSILKMIESSISDGALYPYRFSRKGGADTTAMLSLLKDYWTAVSQVFREAWELPPRRSRLTHGLGIVSLGYLMDAIADYFGGIAPDVVDFVEHLELVAPVCAWTGGFWQLGPYRRHWNDLQNTPRDVQVIADHLLTTYRRALRTSEAATQRASGHRLKPIASRRFSRARCRPGGLVASELQRVAEVERMRKEHEVVKKAVVLLSGGLDSATALAIAKHEGFVPHALSFRYGQRHEAELTAAARVAEAIGVEAHVTANIDLTIFGGSALTDAIDVPKQRSEAEMAKGIPITYVPARNTVFLSIALAWAEVLGAEDVFIGVNALDYSGYPDCRPEYIAAFEQMANLATKAAVEGTQQLRIHAPLIDLTKAQIIQRGLDLGVDYSLTHSCYDPDSDGLACGTCDSCALRRKGFLEAGVPDPTLYRHRFEAVA